MSASLGAFTKSASEIKAGDGPRDTSPPESRTQAFWKNLERNRKRLFWVAAASQWLMALGMLFFVRGADHYAPPEYGGQEPKYVHDAAEEILDTGRTTMTFHTTGYSYFVAATYVVTPNEPVYVLAVQILLLALVVFMTGKIASMFGGPAAEVMAYLVCALYYPLAYYACVFSSVFPALVFMSLATWGLLALHRDYSFRLAVATGVALGIATCHRTNIGTLGVFAALSLLLWLRKPLEVLRRLWPVAVASLLIYGSMTYLNPPEAGQFVRGSQGMQRSLLEGTFQYEDTWWDWEWFEDGEVGERFWAEIRSIERETGQPYTHPDSQRRMGERAWERMAENPLATLKKLVITTVRIWIFIPTHISNHAAKVGIAAQELLVFAFVIYAFVALARQQKRTPWYLLLSAMAVILISHLMLHVEARYSLPVRAVYLALAAVGLAHVAARLRLARCTAPDF